MRTEEYDISTNWKLWYDNSTECYHCPTIHRTTFASSYDSDAQNSSTEGGPGFTMSHYFTKPQPGRNLPLENDFYAFQVFPGFVCGGQGAILHITGMVPISSGRTRHAAHWLARPGTDPDYVNSWSDVWDHTYREDNVAIAVQHRNLSAGMQPWNRYVAGRESGAVHFCHTIWEHYKAALTA